MSEKSLYERLGGVFAIAAVVDRFSDAIYDDPIAGRNAKNPALREWHIQQLGRLPGLKWMRTLWVCAAAGGPFTYVGTRPGQTQMGLEKAHFEFEISPEEFDAVAGVLSRTPSTTSTCPSGKREKSWALSQHIRARWLPGMRLGRSRRSADRMTKGFE